MPQKIYKLSKTNIFFSCLEGTRGGNSQIFRTLDGDGKVGYDEFATMMSHKGSA